MKRKKDENVMINVYNNDMKKKNKKKGFENYKSRVAQHLQT